MKRDRQAVIKQMISREKIGTQEEIKQRLEAEGITVTQATLSRDLREIGLLKLRDEEGRLYYSLSEHVLPSLNPTVKDYVKSVSRASLCWSFTPSWVKLMFWPTSLIVMAILKF